MLPIETIKLNQKQRIKSRNTKTNKKYKSKIKHKINPSRSLKQLRQVNKSTQKHSIKIIIQFKRINFKSKINKLNQSKLQTQNLTNFQT